MKAKEIVERLNSRVEEVVRMLLPQGRQKSNVWYVGSVQGEPGESLKVCLSGSHLGIWKDFASGHGGDLLNLWADTQSVSLKEAIIQAKAYLGISSTEFTPQATPKVYSKPPQLRQVQRFEESAAYLYLNGDRCLQLETMRLYGMDVSRDEVIFPYYRDGELLGVKYLALDRENGKKKIRVSKDCEPCLFGWQAVPQQARKLILVEGELDCLTLHEYNLGCAVLSLPFGGGVGAKQQWIEGEFDNIAIYDEIFLCLDNDEVGRETAMHLVERLGRERCRIVELPYKDANECLQKGVDRGQIAQCFLSAKHVDPEQLSSPINYLSEVIEEFYPSTDKDLGYELPWEKARGQIYSRPSELSVWTGINGHGKSQILGHAAIHYMKQGAKVCIASLEMRPRKLLKRLALQAGAEPFPSKEYIKAIIEWLSENLKIFNVVGTTKDDKLLEVFLYAKRKYGIDVFIIDSFMKCGFGEDDYNAQKSFLDRLCDFKHINNVHVHLVVHPRKGKNELEIPDKMDVKGSGAVTDLADNVFSVWRNKSKEIKLEPMEFGTPEYDELITVPDAQIFCSKQRNGDWEGKIPLWFDKKTLQYLGVFGAKPRAYIEYFGKPVERM